MIPPTKERDMKALIRSFLHGCLVLVPVVVTLYVLGFVFVKIDGLLGLAGWLGVEVPGLGFVLTIALVTAIGAFSSNVLGKRLLALADEWLARVPLVKLIYSALRDFMAALVGEKKSFDRPCVVSLSADGGVRALGFITREDLSAWGLQDHVAVYFPQSMNFAGQLGLFPRARVEPLAVEASQLLPFIVSAGVAGR
jgi:uncharacterized membrane protein